MKLTSTMMIASVYAAFSIISAPASADSEEVVAARSIVQKFQSSLKGELQAAIGAGGFINAVAVCNEKVPQIAEKLQIESGWNINRISLKPRNSANAPDSYFVGILKTFEDRKKSGEDVMNLEWWENNDAAFTYVKAIPTGKLCVACHGSNIQPDLLAAIKALYPSDKAIGFKVGDLRGAFVIKRNH